MSQEEDPSSHDSKDRRKPQRAQLGKMPAWGHQLLPSAGDLPGPPHVPTARTRGPQGLSRWPACKPHPESTAKKPETGLGRCGQQRHSGRRPGHGKAP